MERNMDTRPLMVTIQCCTYNQERYIRQTLDGFVMQKTNFRFEAIVHDDASTDGTAAIVSEYAEKYPDIIKPILETENQYSKGDGSLNRIMDEHTHGKYVAICEGDDYWSDPLKLQKQVDFLESHPDYGMVHTDYDYVTGRRKHFREKTNEDGNWFPRIITEGLPIGTLTVMFRKELYDKIPRLYMGKGWPMGDLPLWCELAYLGKIKYIPEVTSKYRLLNNSASHSDDLEKMIAFKDACIEIRQFYANYYGVQLYLDGYDQYYYRDILRFTCILHDIPKAKHYYKIAKSKDLLTIQTRIYYYATLFPVLEKLIGLVREIH